MNYAKLKTELAEAKYADLTDKAAADLLNAETETMPVEFVSGETVFAAVDAAEYRSLSAEDKNFFNAIIGMASVPIADEKVVGLFAEKSKSRDALMAMQTRKASRAEVLGLGMIYEGDVQVIKAMIAKEKK